MNLTQEIHLFREVVRHLWNSYLIRDADDYTVDTFRNICIKLFDDQIISRLNLNGHSIPYSSDGPTLTEYRLFMKGNGKLPVKVNRDLKPSGYWDYPVDWIPPEEKPLIHPICFYDFDLLGWKNMEYYRVLILECPSHPELSGRHALISCDHVEIELIENE